MTLIAGTSDDAAPTGLAGAIAAAIKAAFPGTLYTLAGIGQIGLDSMAKGIVDAINAEKIDLGTQSSGTSPSQVIGELSTAKSTFSNHNDTYTFANSISVGTEAVYVEGVRMVRGAALTGVGAQDYMVNASGSAPATITFVLQKIPQGERVVMDYAH